MSQPERFKEYSDASHRYFCDGKEYVSVTTVLDLGGLVPPFARDEQARERGSHVHQLCAFDDVPTLATDLIDCCRIAPKRNKNDRLNLRYIPTKYQGYLTAWRRYLQDSGFVSNLVEHRVDDHTNFYAGRLDREGSLPNNPIRVIIDLKSSSTGQIAKDYTRLQLAAYANALKPGHVFERIAVALRPDGKYNCTIFPIHHFHHDLAEFLQLRQRVKQAQENL
jgi:hypothetical protein